MPNEFKEIGDYYVSKSGNNTNPGTDPDSPLLTLDRALELSSANQTIIIGTGVYQETVTRSFSNRVIKGDGIVIFAGNKSQEFISRNVTSFVDSVSFQNIVFTGFLFTINHFAGNSSFELINCIAVDSPFFGRRGSNTHYLGAFNSIFINSPIDSVVQDQGLESPFVNNLAGQARFDSCIFLNSELKTNLGITNCYLDSNSPLIFTAEVNSSSDYFDASENNGGSHNCIRGSVNWLGTQFASLESAQEAIPTLLPSSIDVNPLFISSSPSNLELLVVEGSPLISGGLGGKNIGGVKTGNLQNRSSIEWGLNPQVVGNTGFDANSALTLTSGTASTRESRSIDLGQVRNSPIVKKNGLFDALNNVPDDNNSLSNPNHLVFQAQWAGDDGVFNGVWRNFRYNEPMKVDGSGLYTGDSGYDWGNQNEIQFRFVKIRTTIRNNYNVA